MTSQSRRSRPAKPSIPKTGPKLSQGSLLFRAWRKRSGLTQFEAAKALDFTDSKVSPFELGFRRPNLAVAIHIEKVTGIPAEAWLKPAARSAVEDGRSTAVA